MNEIATIILANGSKYQGYSFASKKPVSGELVFNTGMIGYPETLTDPSYRGQILVLTYPLVGNYGVPPNTRSQGLINYFESEKIQITGLIISDYSKDYSHFRACQSLGHWLKGQGIPALFGIDTRALTKELRSAGTMPAKIIFTGKPDIDFIDSNKLNLIKTVSIKKPKFYKRGKIKVALIDCGVKQSIIRSLLARNVSVIRVPFDFDLSRARFGFDGIVISNGPGDPKMLKTTVQNLKNFLDKKIPILGICLGNQLLALAAGGDTYKLKFGHRGQNQPCLDNLTKRCYITSQNHGYAVKPKLPKDWRTWFINANDQTIEGIRHKNKPFVAVQFHPEANPGPMDTAFIFDDFIELLK